MVLFLICPCFIFGKEPTLSDRASNPITNLSQLQTETNYTLKNYGSSDPSNLITIKPLIALERGEQFPLEQLVRIKFQIPSPPDSPKTKQGTSLGDTQFFDLFIVEANWGRWGIGPAAIFPTATRLDAGQGKWQAGPAIGISILKFPRWQFGFLAQNPISFAGNKHKSNQNFLLFQPFAVYHFLKNTYFVTNGEWTVDWLHKNTQIPLNIGIGHTSALSESLKIDFSLQLQWMAYQNAVKTTGYVNQTTIQFSFNILFN